MEQLHTCLIISPQILSKVFSYLIRIAKKTLYLTEGHYSTHIE